MYMFTKIVVTVGKMRFNKPKPSTCILTLGQKTGGLMLRKQRIIFESTYGNPEVRHSNVSTHINNKHNLYG